MHRRTWSAACALALVAAGVPAVAAAAAPSAEGVAVRGTLVATLGSGRDAAGRPVETRDIAVRTGSGAFVQLEDSSAQKVLGAARPGDDVEVVVDAPEGLSFSALRSSSPDAPAAALTKAGEHRARSLDVLAQAPTAAAPKAGVHSAYLVRVDDATATGEFTFAEGRAAVSRGGAYWKTETNGIVNDIVVRKEATLKTSDVCSEIADGADPTGQSYFDVWRRAQKLFPGLDALTTSRTHLVVMLPRSCFTDGSIGWIGLATIGEKGLTSGGLVFLAEDDAHTTAHELGHNFGLGHSNLITGSGAYEYGGTHSVMGAPPVDHTQFTPPALDPAYRKVLDILSAGSVTSGRPGVDTRINAVTRGGVVTLRFSDNSGNLVYTELRDGSGRDATSFYASSFAVGNTYDLGKGVRFSTIIPDSNGTPTLYTLGGTTDGVEWSVMHAGDRATLASAARTIGVKSISGGVAVISFPKAQASTIKMSSLSIRYGRSAKVSVKVTGDSKPQGAVQFYVGKKKVASARLSTSGRATATLPSSVKPGTQVVTARYDGDVMLAVSRAKKTVKVAKGKPSIKVTKASKVRTGSKAAFTVRVGTVAGTKPLGTVRAKVGSKYVSKSAKIVRSGKYWVAKVRTSKLPRGTVKLVYTPSKKTSKLLATTTVSSGRTAR